jgi:hypothetical protein
MKLLVIVSSHEMNPINYQNIEELTTYFTASTDITVEYCGISNTDDFHNYENIIKFKFKIVNQKHQFSKICDFISDNKCVLNYDWYVKIRPDIKLLEAINFNILSDNSINARARYYSGPKCIKNGMSVNGEGIWRNIGDCYYDMYERNIILDDQIYIFHNNVIKMGAFDKVNPVEYNNDIVKSNEWIQSRIWKNRNISFNVIGLNLLMTKYNCYSGNINM